MDIGESIHEILLRSDTFAALFYLSFLKDYPEVQQHFHGVDMKRQNLLLTVALMVVERHSEHRYAATTDYLHLLGQQHLQRSISPDLYPKWREAMLGTLERFHGLHWDAALAHQWAAALDSAIETMLKAYPD